LSRGESFLLLGGAGLTGKQIARRIAQYLSPRKIIIASLLESEVTPALSELKADFGNQAIEWVGLWGNVFIRTEYANTPRQQLLDSEAFRDSLYADLFGELETAYLHSYLVDTILKHKPDVIVDSINTATAISYQDVDRASAVARQKVDGLLDSIRSHKWDEAAAQEQATEQALENLLVSQSLPQLVRHIQLLHRATREAGTRMYLKIGTTGTGGMGLNIPYTHSEDKPSSKLMAKTAVAFAHTGLMFLMARTPDSPIVKEIKPGAMIGYADVSHRSIMNRATGKPAQIMSNRLEILGQELNLREETGDYQTSGDLTLPVVDTGENGLFTKGEFETITSLRQMEFVTPEEIALEAMLEIKGGNTGRDVIGAIDSAVMNPTYRAGYLRQQVLADMTALEQESHTHSVALGQLGPPELSKLLWECELLRIEFTTFKAVQDHKAAQVSERLYRRIQSEAGLSQLITSIGVPILAPDGKSLLRGPLISIPEMKTGSTLPISKGDVDGWAAKGWVDLRPENMQHWQDRFGRMQEARQRIRLRGSAAVARTAYLFDDIRIGEIAGWIFNNESGGYRIK
jgi:hypothetical protein